MPIACTSTTVGSLRITVTTVHTVVSCVASRNRGTLGTPTEPDGQGAARDGGDSRDPMGRNSPTGQQKNYSAPRSLTARLGDSFYFAVSKIVESLLRRGARGRSALESRSWLGNKLRLPCAGGGPTKAKRTPAKHPTGAPGGRCLPALGTGHSGEKTVFGCAPGRFILFRQVRNSESLLRRGARDLERTALRPRRPPLRRAGAPKGRLIGHPGEKNGQRQPQQNARWACRSAPIRQQKLSPPPRKKTTASVSPHARPTRARNDRSTG